VLTQKQVSALKYLVTQAKGPRESLELAKKILWFLLEESKGGTKEVCVVLFEDVHGTRDEVAQAAYRVGGFHSANMDVHLDQICIAANTEFRFSLHYGEQSSEGFDSSDQFGEEEVPLRYTFWFAKGNYSKVAKVIEVTRAELDAIDLSRPNLYPSLENQKT